MKMKLGFMLGAFMITLTGCNGKISCDDPEIASGILATIAQKMEDTKNAEKRVSDQFKYRFKQVDKINISNLVVELQEVDETDINTAEPYFLSKKEQYLTYMSVMMTDATKSIMKKNGIEMKTQICSYRIKDTISNKYIISFHEHQHLFYKYTDDDRWKFGGLSYTNELNRWHLSTE